MLIDNVPLKSYVHKIEMPGMTFDWLTKSAHSESTIAFLKKWLGRDYFRTLMMRRPIAPRQVDLLSMQIGGGCVPKQYCLPSLTVESSVINAPRIT
jgi:hypothetical protein